MYYIIGLRVDNRTHNAPELQKALTSHGCNIKVRLGLHDTQDDSCSNDGLILLQISGGMPVAQQMIADFNQVQGITAKLMEI